MTAALAGVTTPSLPPDRSSTPAHRRTRVTTLGVLRAEWVKLRSLRSNVAILAGTAATMLLTGLIFSAIVGGLISNPDEGGELAADPTGATLQGVLLAQLIIGVLGVLAITSEYTTGMIRSTLAMVPTRIPVLWAKATVIMAVTFVMMLATSFVVFFAGQALIANGNTATTSLTDPGVLRAITGTAGYLTGIALIGLAAGTLLRSTAGAISTLVGVVFLLPGLGSILLPTSWRENVLPYLPSNAGSALMNVHQSPELLSPTAGALVFLVWVLVPLAAATIALKRRPA